MTETKQKASSPQLGQGIFLVKDISDILNLDYEKVHRWIHGYWDEHFKTTFGKKKTTAINFYSLIEFYTFFELRKTHSAQFLRKAHAIMAEELNTPYPFATADAFDFEHKGKRKRLYYEKDGNIINIDGKHQISLSFVKPFLEKIEFDNGIAKRFFPLENSKNIVVDPLRQFGQPIINGTSIKAETVYNLHQGGETDETICILYDLTLDKVQDAISYYEKAA